MEKGTTGSDFKIEGGKGRLRANAPLWKSGDYLGFSLWKTVSENGVISNASVDRTGPWLSIQIGPEEINPNAAQNSHRMFIAYLIPGEHQDVEWIYLLYFRAAF